MKLSTLALAAGLALAGSAAQSQVIARLSGASAPTINEVRALRLLCTNAAGTFALYKTASSTTSLGNIFTGTCTQPFTADTVQVRLNVAGGTYSAVLNRTGNDNVVAVPLIDPAQGSCVALGAGTGPLSFMAAGELRNCGSTGQVLETTDGGFMDVPGSVFRASGLFVPSQVNDATDFPGARVQQVFGVAMTKESYEALQAYQVARGQLPATCASTVVNGNVTSFTGLGVATPECQPNLSRAAMASFAVIGINDAKRGGFNFLLGGTATLKNDLPATQAIVPDVPLGTDFVYCRRPDTSGTQAAANLYFLSRPTASGQLGALNTAGGAASGTQTIGANYRVTTNSGSSDVRNCLNTVGTYGGGILSLENNPIGGSDTYRFVKINGQWGSEGVAGSSQTAESAAGRYDFVYELVKYCPGGVCVPVLDAMDNIIQAGSSSPGLFLSSESRFWRGGNPNSPYRTR
jgi:hypothetical protein